MKGFFKKSAASLGIAVFTVGLLTGCGDESADWEGKYEITDERLDDSGMQYVTVKVDGVTDEESLKSFVGAFKMEHPAYNSHDSLFIRVDDGGKISNYKVANSDKGAAQTGLEEHTEEFEYNE